MPTLSPVDTKKGRGMLVTPPPGGTAPRRFASQVLCPCRSSQLLQGQTAIYGSTNRQTAPRRRQPRPARLRLAGTAPYGHPPLPENCPVENLSYPGSSGNRDVAGGLGAAPPVMRPGGVVASPRRNKERGKALVNLTRKKPLRRRRKGAFFPSHGPRKRL